MIAVAHVARLEVISIGATDFSVVSAPERKRNLMAEDQESDISVARMFERFNEIGKVQPSNLANGLLIRPLPLAWLNLCYGLHFEIEVDNFLAASKTKIVQKIRAIDLQLKWSNPKARVTISENTQEHTLTGMGMAVNPWVIAYPLALLSLDVYFIPCFSVNRVCRTSSLHFPATKSASSMRPG